MSMFLLHLAVRSQSSVISKVAMQTFGPGGLSPHVHWTVGQRKELYIIHQIMQQTSLLRHIIIGGKCQVSVQLGPTHIILYTSQKTQTLHACSPSSSPRMGLGTRLDVYNQERMIKCALDENIIIISKWFVIKLNV